MNGLEILTTILVFSLGYVIGWVVTLKKHNKVIAGINQRLIKLKSMIPAEA